MYQVAPETNELLYVIILIVVSLSRRHKELGTSHLLSGCVCVCVCGTFRSDIIFSDLLVGMGCRNK